MHVTSEEDLCFEACDCYFSNLFEWVRITGFSIPDLDITKKDVEFKYSTPDPINILSSDDTQIAFKFKLTGLTLRGMTKDVNITQDLSVEIKTQTKTNYSILMKSVGSVQSFLGFLTQTKIHPYKIYFYNPGEEQPPVEYIFSSVRGLLFSAQTQTGIPLIEFREVYPRIGQAYEMWERKKEGLGPVIDLYMGNHYNQHLYMENVFLGLIHGIEAYHRAFVGGQNMDENEHSKIVEAMIDSVEDTHKSWAREKLEYTNELSLRRRLKQIFETNIDLLNEYVANWKRFVHKVVNTRNYFVHYDSNITERCTVGQDMYDATEILKLIIEMALLKELDFSTEEINTSLKRRYINFKYDHP